MSKHKVRFQKLFPLIVLGLTILFSILLLLPNNGVIKIDADPSLGIKFSDNTTLFHFHNTDKAILMFLDIWLYLIALIVFIYLIFKFIDKKMNHYKWSAAFFGLSVIAGILHCCFSFNFWYILRYWSYETTFTNIVIISTWIIFISIEIICTINFVLYYKERQNFKNTNDNSQA